MTTDTTTLPVFFVLEGVDGAGKTTQIRALAKHYQDQGMEVVVTREPGGTPLAEKIRHLLLDKEETESIHPVTELLLMFAARKQHVEQVIIPALNRGAVVLCDRFINSSWAYQVKGHDLPADLFFSLVQHTVMEAVPHFTCILDISDEESLARLQARTNETNRLDEGSEEYRRKINAAVREFSQVPGHLLIDGSCPIHEVTEKLIEVFNEVIDEVRSRKETETTGEPTGE